MSNDRSARGIHLVASAAKVRLRAGIIGTLILIIPYRTIWSVSDLFEGALRNGVIFAAVAATLGLGWVLLNYLRYGPDSGARLSSMLVRGPGLVSVGVGIAWLAVEFVPFPDDPRVADAPVILKIALTVAYIFAGVSVTLLCTFILRQKSYFAEYAENPFVIPAATIVSVCWIAYTSIPSAQSQIPMHISRLLILVPCITVSVLAMAEIILACKLGARLSTTDWSKGNVGGSDAGPPFPTLIALACLAAAFFGLSYSQDTLPVLREYQAFGTHSGPLSPPLSGPRSFNTTLGPHSTAKAVSSRGTQGLSDAGLEGLTDGMLLHHAQAASLPTGSASFEACQAVNWSDRSVWKDGAIIPWAKFAEGSSVCIQVAYADYQLWIATGLNARSKNRPVVKLSIWICSERSAAERYC